jgi:hypothetical protein
MRLVTVKGPFRLNPVLRKDSPYVGRLPRHGIQRARHAQRNGTGTFSREVMNRFPVLPLEEEGRLDDMPLRENFVEQVLPVADAKTGPTIAGPECWARSHRPAVWSSSTLSTS